MPWTPEEYRRKHNKKLSRKQAAKAAKQAEAIIASGAPEGVAIATANKHARDTGHSKSLQHMMRKR